MGLWAAPLSEWMEEVEPRRVILGQRSEGQEDERVKG